MDNYSKHFI